jgi:hypothetical protein
VLKPAGKLGFCVVGAGVLATGADGLAAGAEADGGLAVQPCDCQYETSEAGTLFDVIAPVIGLL